MAKKRKVSRKAEPSGPRDVDAKDARLTIKTYEDVAGSDDEYWANQDRIDLDDDADQPRSKRLKRQDKEDAFLEASDEEILGEEESDESEEEEEEAPARSKAGKKTVGAGDEDVSEDDEGRADEEEGDEGWWGSSKKEYYDADHIETEADALVRCLLAWACVCVCVCGKALTCNYRKKRPKRGACRPRSWPRCRRPTLLLTRANGWRRKNKPGKRRRS